jgi:GNAT superfamily N-acetyltransferase
MQKNYLKLLDESWPGIEQNILRCEALGFQWEASKIFSKGDKGDALSHAALLECSMLLEGKRHNMAVLHGICTKASHRQYGYATELITEALEWSKSRTDCVFLFTEIPSFYERLSFYTVQEHRFHIAYPRRKGSQSLRPLIAPDDNELFLRCFKERAPLSNKLWLEDRGLIASFNALFATYPTYWSLSYSSTIDGLLSYQLDNNDVHLFDIVARQIPSLDLVMDHFPENIEKIYFYFSPDLLTDEAIAEPYLYDNGHLMVHGSWRFSQPFMVSPLSRC